MRATYGFFIIDGAYGDYMRSSGNSRDNRDRFQHSSLWQLRAYPVCSRLPNMKRLMKHEGMHNFVLEEVEIPTPGVRQLLLHNKVTLISRGSEIGGRYLSERALEQSDMGYSAAGVVEAVGPEVVDFKPGDRVMAKAPHAEYVVVDVEPPGVFAIPDELSFEDAAFWPLARSSVLWSWTSGISPGDTLVILGQGVVGSLCMQTMRMEGPGKIIAVDAIPLRCEIASILGADAVINVNDRDPVEAVKQMTDDKGAEVVVEAVGGPAGIVAFDQAQEMTCSGGTILLVGLYHTQPLRLYAHKVFDKRVVGCRYVDYRTPEALKLSLGLLLGGQIRPQPMISHRLDGRIEAAEAFRMLHERPHETMCVTLWWDESPERVT